MVSILLGHFCRLFPLRKTLHKVLFHRFFKAGSGYALKSSLIWSRIEKKSWIWMRKKLTRIHSPDCTVVHKRANLNTGHQDPVWSCVKYDTSKTCEPQYGRLYTVYNQPNIKMRISNLLSQSALHKHNS